MKLLIKKEWKLTVTPVPLLFLLLSALVLVPSYPYYVTFSTMPSAFSSCCRPPARTGTCITWRCCRSRSAIWSGRGFRPS